MHDPAHQEDDASARWLRPSLIAPWKEIAAVVALVIGISTFMSTWQALHGSSHSYVTILMSDRQLVRMLMTESSILGIFFVLLHWCGWKISDFKIKPTWSNTGAGFLLVLGAMIANSVTVFTGFIVFYLVKAPSTSFFTFVIANNSHLPAHSIQVSWLTIIPLVIFNAFFEEITCMGYAFNQFAAKRGPYFALILTVLLRMSCHTYQGAIHALGIGAAFFISGLIYCWTRSLWPLILAHIIIDTLSFSAIKFLHG